MTFLYTQLKSYCFSLSPHCPQWQNHCISVSPQYPLHPIITVITSVSTLLHLINSEAVSLQFSFTFVSSIRPERSLQRYATSTYFQQSYHNLTCIQEFLGTCMVYVRLLHTFLQTSFFFATIIFKRNNTVEGFQNTTGLINKDMRRKNTILFEDERSL